MAHSLGTRIADLRKRRGITQDELAEKMGISAQAVSKWENDISCPDILMLPILADFFGVTIDSLLRGEREVETKLVPVEERKDINKMMLRIIVDSAEGDRVRVNLPIALVKMFLELGTALPEFRGSEALKSIDFEAVLLMVDSGVIGEIVSVKSADGDIVSIFVE